MLPCHNCIHRRDIPGDAHVQCDAHWENGQLDELLEHCPTFARQWFFFPINYDPRWGPNTCPHAERRKASA